MPKVSICIPAYNQPTSLRRALESVFLQSFKDYEVIITDDSRDNSVSMVADEFGQHANLRYYRNKTRKDTPENWNEAVRLASGELIKILHHDDWFSDENSLADFVKMLDRNPEVDFAFSPSFACGADRRLRFEHAPSESQIQLLRADPRVLFQGNFIGAPSSTIYRRRAKREFDPKLKWLVDIDFYICLLTNNPELGYARRPLVCIALETSGKVTDECAGNKQVEVFEFLYLYAKISKDRPFDYGRCQVIWRLFDRFNIKSHQDLLDIGINWPLPREIDDILIFRRLYRRAGRRLAIIGMTHFYLYQQLRRISRRRDAPH